MPTAVRVKRDGPKAKPKPKNTMGIERDETAAAHAPSSRPVQATADTAATKDDAYAQFMKEVSGLL